MDARHIIIIEKYIAKNNLYILYIVRGDKVRFYDDNEINTGYMTYAEALEYLYLVTVIREKKFWTKER